MNKIFIKNILIVVSLKVDNSMYVQKYECSLRASNYKSVIKSLTYKSEEEVEKLKIFNWKVNKSKKRIIYLVDSSCKISIIQ